MYRFKAYLSFVLAAICLPFVLIAQPTISSFTPLTGKPGDAVTLAGTNFNTTPGNNIVFFGATRAIVTAATATSITTTVPVGATYAPLTVLNTGTGLSAYSRKNFTPVFSPSKINLTPVDFLTKQDFAAGDNPYSTAIGDLDGDGKPDLVVVNSLSQTISVYRNTAVSGSIGAGSFAPKVDFATGVNPRSVAIGDLDGDGKPDLAVANTGSLSIPGSRSISVYRNTASSGNIGAGSFATKVDLVSGFEPTAITIGDLDADGKPDLAVSILRRTASNSQGYVAVHRNVSTTGSLDASSFAPYVDFSTGGLFAISIAIADLDGDSKPDLAIANRLSDNISVLRNTATSGSITAGSFAASVDFGTGSEPLSVAIGDLDGDGRNDLAVANFASNTVSVLRNTATSGSIGPGSFDSRYDFETGVEGYSIAIGDLNGDGRPDLAEANGYSSGVSILRNTAAPGSIDAYSFAPKVDFFTSGFPVAVALGDLDGDSKPDVTIANQNPGLVSVLRNADIIPPLISITAVVPSKAKPGDAVIITGNGFNTTTTNNVVFFGATRATVTAATATSVTVTVPPGATYAPVTLLNKVTGFSAYSSSNFTPVFSPAKTSITSSDFLPKQDFTTGTEPSSVATGDLDGDGKPDLVVVNNGANTVSVFRNTSSSGTISPGSFAPKVDFTTRAGAIAVAIGDLDGDGKPDLAVANLTSATVSVLRNTSSPGSITAASFAPKVDFITGIEPFMVKISDLDGNGKPDLVVAASNLNGISILLNTATPGSITSGSFAPKVDIETGVVPSALAVGDLDGDGGPDLVIGWAESVSVFRLIPGGFGFEPRVDFATAAGGAAISIAVGDVDGDGKTDLAVANYGLVSVSILRNTATPGSIGTGSFAPVVNFDTGSEPYSIAAGDLNGDGKPDLAVANISTNSLTVLRNTATPGSINSGSFAAKVDFVTGTSPRSVAIGDLDGDGKPDLVTANNFSTSVSVLRNADLPGVVYTFTGSGNWDNPANWSGNIVPPSIIPANTQIIINPTGSAECILNVPVTVNNSSSITVASGKKFRILGNLTITQ